MACPYCWQTPASDCTKPFRSVGIAGRSMTGSMSASNQVGKGAAMACHFLEGAAQVFAALRASREDVLLRLKVLLYAPRVVLVRLAQRASELELFLDRHREPPTEVSMS